MPRFDIRRIAARLLDILGFCLLCFSAHRLQVEQPPFRPDSAVVNRS